MLQITIHITDVDYSAISSTVVPMVLEAKGQSHSDSKLVSLLSKYKNLSAKTISTALKVLPQNSKDDIAVYLMRLYSAEILNMLNRFLADKEIPMSFREISISKAADIECMLALREVDYGQLINAAYPQALSKFGENSKPKKFLSVLESFSGQSDKIIRAMLEVLSQEEKDEIVSSVISVYEPEILSLVNTLAAEKGIKLSFAGIELGDHTD